MHCEDTHTEKFDRIKKKKNSMCKIGMGPSVRISSVQSRVVNFLPHFLCFHIWLVTSLLLPQTQLIYCQKWKTGCYCLDFVQHWKVAAVVFKGTYLKPI